MDKQSGLSKTEYYILAKLSEAGKQVFTVSEFNEVFPDMKEDAKYVYLKRLADKGSLIRFERGKYIIVPLEAGIDKEWAEDSFLLASKLIDPYAIAYWTALNYWGFTEQIPNVTFVQTTKKKERRKVEIFNDRIVFVQIKEKNFFGITKIWLRNREINITDKEKTLLDTLDKPQYCGGLQEGIKALWNAVEDSEFDWDKLSRYALKVSNRAVLKRLGYLSEFIDVPNKGNYQKVWQENLSSGFIWLDPLLKGGKVKHNTKWGVKVNIPVAKFIRTLVY